MPSRCRAPSAKRTALGNLTTRHDNPGHNGLERQRVKGIQRARMLAAMAQACAEHGAANVTVAHVVARSGISRRTFYEQFADREDCFLAAVEEALQCAARRVVPAYEAGGAWRERMRTALVALLEFAEDEPQLAGLLLVETPGGGERALRRRQEVLSRVLAAVDEGRREAPRSGAGVSSLSAEGIVGGVLSILRSRLSQSGPTSSSHAAGPPSSSRMADDSLTRLAGQLTSMIVLPYLGPAAARRELNRPVPRRHHRSRPVPSNPLHDLGMRLTYRTIRMLVSVGDHPCASNRELALAAEISDQGQASKLLARLQKLGLIENVGAGHARGGPNAWKLTPRGEQVWRALAPQAGGHGR